MKMNYIIKIAPKPLPRARVSRYGTYYTPQQQEYAETLRYLLVVERNKQKGVVIPPNSKIALSLEFGFKMPISWSKKKKTEMLDEPHTQTPDIDNLVKNVLDRGNGILWSDDRNIYSLTATKRWSDENYIKISVDIV